MEPPTNPTDVELPVRLRARAAGLTARWREAVEDRRRARGQRVLPSPPTPGGLVELVRWVVGAPPDEVDPSHALAGSLGELIVEWRSGGHLLEEVLLEVRLLEDILLDAVAEELAGMDGGSSAGTARVLGGVARRTGVVMTLAAGMYNEEVEADLREERRRLNDFARTVSHEMRTPVGAAFTAGRMLQELGDELPEDERRQLLEIVGRGLRRATHLIESVTSLTVARRSDSDPDRLQSLRSVVEDVIAEVRPLAERRGVRIEVDGPLPAASVDARRAGLALLALLDNGIRHHRPDAEDPWVRVGVSRDPTSYGWRVSVRDNGPGIAAPDRERVFRRFRRAGEGVAVTSGLGLSIARDAVHQLGGEIELESEPGRGSAFVFIVPDAEEVADTGEGEGEEGA